MKNRFIASVLLVLLSISAGVVFAQDDGDEGTIIEVLNSLTVEGSTPDYVNRYADIPQSRTEDGGFVLGNPDAQVVIVEFADFMCPHCQDYEPTIHEVIENFVRTGEIQLEYRMFPIVHPNLSPLTAQIAECAGEQGNFWGAHDYIFDLASNQQIDPELVNNVVETLGLDMDEMQTCLQTADQFLTDVELGESVGVSGTPSVLLRVGDIGPNWVVANGEPLRGALPYDLVALIIQTAQDGAFLESE